MTTRRARPLLVGPFGSVQDGWRKRGIYGQGKPIAWQQKPGAAHLLAHDIPLGPGTATAPNAASALSTSLISHAPLLFESYTGSVPTLMKQFKYPFVGPHAAL
jgi:hypothetical protein